MKTINPNIYPKDGYKFIEQDGTVFSADSWAGVIARVIKYRQRQHKPVDTVKADVIAQACQRNPNLCRENNGQRDAKLKEATLKTRVLKWLSAINKIRQQSGMQYVSESLRDARADVCNRCPYDKQLHGGCSSCKAALNELQGQIIGGRKGESRYSACPIIGEYLPVSVWIEQPAVDNGALWVECWRKKTL